jgi:hypothetical protein
MKVGLHESIEIVKQRSAAERKMRNRVRKDPDSARKPGRIRWESGEKPLQTIEKDWNEHIDRISAAHHRKTGEGGDELKNGRLQEFAH